jgi:hypothetical protein
MTIKRVTLFVLIVLQLTQLDASIISDLNGPQDDDGDLYSYFLSSEEKLQNRSYSEIPATLHCTALHCTALQVLTNQLTPTRCVAS